MKFYLMAIIAGGILTSTSAFAQGPPQSTANPHPITCMEPCVKKICVVEPAKKKITKTLYDCKCEDFCLIKCSHGFLQKHRHRNCDGCETECCVQCEKKVRTKRVLYKKIVTTECDTLKCVRKEVPECVVCPPVCCPPACAGTVTLTPELPVKQN